MNKLITLIIKKFVWLFFAVRFVHIEWGSGRVMLPCWHSLISKINIKKFSSKKQNKIDKAATINLHRYTYYVRCHGSNVKCRDHHEKCSRLNVCVLWIKANLLANLKSKLVETENRNIINFYSNQIPMEFYFLSGFSVLFLPLS